MLSAHFVDGWEGWTWRCVWPASLARLWRLGAAAGQQPTGAVYPARYSAVQGGLGINPYFGDLILKFD